MAKQKESPEKVNKKISELRKLCTKKGIEYDDEDDADILQAYLDTYSDEYGDGESDTEEESDIDEEFEKEKSVKKPKKDFLELLKEATSKGELKKIRTQFGIDMAISGEIPAIKKQLKVEYEKMKNLEKGFSINIRYNLITRKIEGKNKLVLYNQPLVQNAVDLFKQNSEKFYISPDGKRETNRNIKFLEGELKRRFGQTEKYTTTPFFENINFYFDSDKRLIGMLEESNRFYMLELENEFVSPCQIDVQDLLENAKNFEVIPDDYFGLRKKIWDKYGSENVLIGVMKKKVDKFNPFRVWIETKTNKVVAYYALTSSRYCSVIKK